jgi:hypothetical protein
VLNPHDDPQAALDFRLSDIAEEIELIERAPAEARAHYRDRMADLGADLFRIASETPRENSTCESQAHSNNAGPGGKPPSQAKSRRSTKWTPTPGSTPSASSPTASGRKARSSLPASGGKPTSTPKPANSRRPKNAAPKSTASSSTPGAHGHG